MRRVGRIIYNLAVAGSLLLFVGTAGIWVRSYWLSDVLHWERWSGDRTRVNEVTFRCSRGGLQFISSESEGLPLDPAELPQFETEWERASFYPVFATSVRQGTVANFSIHGALGFEIARASGWGLWKDGDPFVSASSVTVPIWFVILISAMLPAIYLFRFWRRRRIARRLGRWCCVRCGYDLRSSAGRCPECGMTAQLG